MSRLVHIENVTEISLVPWYPRYFLSVFFDCKALQKRRIIESNETYRVQTVYVLFIYVILQEIMILINKYQSTTNYIIINVT